jgi:hypothetical protein
MGFGGSKSHIPDASFLNFIQHVDDCLKIRFGRAAQYYGLVWVGL